MPEEIKQKPEQENEEKVQHSLREVLQLLNKLRHITITETVVTRAIHVKQKQRAKELLREQAKSDAVVICAKYKIGLQEQSKAVEEVTKQYEQQFEQMKESFEAEEESIRGKKEASKSEYDKLRVKQSEVRKAYKQEKKSKEYKEFLAVAEKIKKDIDFYENLANMPPESKTLMLDALKKHESKNPLNKYAEELKKIEQRKNEIETANKKYDDELKELEDNWEKKWDELDINKQKALADTKNKDLIKPSLKQRALNFFVSSAKRIEKAKAELKQKAKDTMDGIKKVGGVVTSSIVGGVKKTKESLAQGYQNAVENWNNRMNVMHERLTANYSLKEERVNALRDEIMGFVKGSEEEQFVTYPVPEAKEPIIDTYETPDQVIIEEAKAPIQEGINPLKARVKQIPKSGPGGSTSDGPEL